MSDPDLQSLWQSQEPQEPPMPLAEIRAAATKFQRRIKVRNTVEYVAGAVVVAAFAWQAAVRDSLLTQLGCVAIILGTFVMLWQMHARGSARPAPEHHASAVLDFHRAELARQRDALASVPIWYLGPALPGMALIMFDRWRTAPAEGEALQAGIGTAIVVAVFGVVWLLNHLGAKALQKEIDQLDALRRG